MILGIGLFGLLAASMASFLIEKDREKEIDPQISEISERLERIEGLLLERRQTSDESIDDPDDLSLRSGSLRSPSASA